MLIDEIEVLVEAGHGGPGKVSFGPRLKSGPDGGDGGLGGNVYAVGVDNPFILKRYLREKVCSAENGSPGGRNQRTGADGKDLDLLVPVGSELTDLETEKVFNVEKKGQKVFLAKGGLGGRGNYRIRSSRNTTPKFAQPGLPGQKRKLKIVLKLIADFGLVGLPNAGKSSLLNALTKAKARVGAYPFTTLEPNLGELNGKIVADIPGLIEGASAGKGLGTRFLKHVEKVGLLVHCLASDSKDLAGDYQTVLEELRNFSPKLLKKKQLAVLTKTDLVSAKELEQKIKTVKKLVPQVYSASIYDPPSLGKLTKILS